MRDRYMKIIPGLFVVISVLLGMYVNSNWYWFTVFVGANLFQSGITKWCFWIKSCINWIKKRWRSIKSFSIELLVPRIHSKLQMELKS